MPVGIIVLLIGLVIGFIAFAFAASNLYRVTHELNFSLDDVMGRHLAAIVAMALGALLSLVGIILTILPYLK